MVNNTPMPVVIFYFLAGFFFLILILAWLVRRVLRRGRNAIPLSSDSFAGQLLDWFLTPIPTPFPARPRSVARARTFPPAPLTFTVYQLRAVNTVLLLGGTGLVLLAQTSYHRVFPAWQGRVLLVLAFGLLIFLLGGRLMMRPRPPRLLVRLGWYLSHFFHIAGWQVALLGLAPFYVFLARLAAGNSVRALNPTTALLAWFAALACVVLGSYRYWQDVPFRLSRREWLGLLTLFLLAFLLRGTFLSRYPSTLSGDEGSAGLEAVQFIEGQYDNPFTVGWFSFPSLYYWLQSVGIRLLGQTTAGLRLMSAVAGAATVVAIYGWGRVMFNRLMGGIAAAFLLVAHFHIQFSRIGLNNIWDGLFLVIALAALWYGWKTGWRGAFIICGLATGLGQYFYVSMRILPVLLLLWVGAAAYFRAPTLRRRWPDLLLTGFIALTVFLPLLLYFADNPNEFNAPMQRVTLFDGWIEGEQLRTGETPMRIIVRQMVSTGLGITHTPLRHWYNPGTPLLLPASAALFLLGLLWSLVAFDLRYLLLWLPLLAHVFLGGFSQDAPASQRFVFVMPVVIMFVALPVARMVSWLQQVWPERRRWVQGFAAAFLLWLMLTDLHFYFFRVYQNGYILGGINTELATSIAHYLRDQPVQGQQVYFFGFPRMGYASLSTIPYLAPHMRGIDINEPLSAPPEFFSGNMLCIFLPERLGERVYVEVAYPGGVYQEFYRQNGDLLFAVYDVP